ncbi:MAG: 30S ribosomal protein S8 [Chitinivibrionales bacterium]|nr:30S ribosomal protein S8 [Chitinivibrionales bacterium]
MDPISDMFTSIRNAVGAKKRTVSMPASSLKKEIVRILFENHFISKYAFVNDTKQGTIKILLKWDPTMQNAIRGIKRVSTPGRRRYAPVDKVPKVLRGMGISIVSTSKGLMTDEQCRKNKIGGEVIGLVW